MVRVESQVTIERPPGEVYEFLADARNDPAWCPPVLDVERAGGDDTTQRYEATVKPGPKRLHSSIVVDTSERPDRITFEGSNEMGDFHGHYDLEERGDATRVTMVSNLELRGFMRLLSPIIQWQSDANATEQFRQLKTLLEGARA